MIRHFEIKFSRPPFFFLLKKLDPFFGPLSDSQEKDKNVEPGSDSASACASCSDEEEHSDPGSAAVSAAATSCIRWRSGEVRERDKERFSSSSFSSLLKKERDRRDSDRCRSLPPPPRKNQTQPSSPAAGSINS